VDALLASQKHLTSNVRTLINGASARRARVAQLLLVSRRVDVCGAAAAAFVGAARF
jgi:hypothetical protein